MNYRWPCRRGWKKGFKQWATQSSHSVAYTASFPQLVGSPPPFTERQLGLYKWEQTAVFYNPGKGEGEGARSQSCQELIF